jgi:hypothetical protein
MSVCVYLVDAQEEQFALNGGDTAWLDDPESVRVAG